MLKILNILLPLGYSQAELRLETARRLRVEEKEIKSLILDKSELVKGNPLGYKLTALCRLEPELEKKLALVLRKKGVELFTEPDYAVEKTTLTKRPVVVGFGPAGIFAALVLAEAGVRPIIIERGSETEKRISEVKQFADKAILNSESNIQFGEGGAGAFSDGKLKIGYKDSRKRKILNEFVECGASDTILYMEKAHVGSDVLHDVIVNLRKKIISLGGEIHFNSKLIAIDTKNSEVSGITYEKDGVRHNIDTDAVILATGHSARDTYELLFNMGIKMEAKGFGVGVRIEHPQSLINEIEYSRADLADSLGAADYKMVTHLDNGRSLYTFCMCPGGYVVPAASEEGGLCTNGMSEFARDSENANTALLVSVNPDDFPDKSVLSGIEYQRKIERLAYKAAGSNYSAPIIKLSDFMARKNSTRLGNVKPTYKPDTVFVSPDDYLPDYVCESLRKGIAEMCDYKKGYGYPDAIITGPETRTTSPIKIIRDENHQASSLKGLYPAGEGAGYAGGIISSAVDGMLSAEKLLSQKGTQK